MLRILIFILAAVLAPTAFGQVTIKIGVVGPMAFTIGKHHRAGAEMARDEINAAGGIHVGGRRMQIELVVADTNELQSIPDATNAVERVITRDRVDFLVGGFRSDSVLAMQEVAMDGKKIFIGAGASTDKLGQNVEEKYERYKYWFRITPSKNSDLGRQLAESFTMVAGQIRKDLKKEIPKVAILAEKAAWTEGLIAAAQGRLLPALKMAVVGVWQPSDRATDVTAELAAIERANADIVFTLLSGPVGITVGRQMGERNMKAVAFGINVEAQKDEFWKAAAGKANFVATLDTYGEGGEMTPRTLPFVKAFRTRFKETPTYNAGTYDAVYLLKEAIEKAGTIDAERLVPTIEKLSFIGTSAVIEFDKRHDPVWGLGKLTGVAVQWQDGQKVVFWPPQVKGARPFKLP